MCYEQPNFRLKIQGYIHYLQRWDVIFKTKGPERCLLGATKASSRWREVSWVALILLVIPFRAARLVPASDRASQTAQEHADRGLQLAQSGDLKGAEAELHKALALSPNDPDFLTDLGGILGMQQKLEEANTYFERALKIDPGNSTIRRDLAANQWQLGRLREAKDNLERILRTKPGDPPTVLLLGMVAENLGDFAKAASLLASVPALVNQRPESIAALARSYYHLGDKQKARDMLGGLRSHPAGPKGVFLGGQVASEAGDGETAMKLFTSIKSGYPDQGQLAYNIALAEYRSNDFRQTETTLLDLIGAGHQTSEAYNLLAWSYYKQAKFDETVRAFDQAIDRDPSRESNYLDLGKVLSEHHLYSVAAAVAKKAVERIPDSYRAYMMKGMIETKQARYNEAVASYSRAIELNPTSAEANFNLASGQAMAGMTKEAEATFERGIKRFPNDAPTYQEYALMLLKLAEAGDGAAESRATALLKTAISLDPTLVGPHYHLGNLWLSENRTEEALRELEAAAKLDPNDAKAHYALSRAFRHLGQNDQAAKELRVYEKLKPQE